MGSHGVPSFIEKNVQFDYDVLIIGAGMSGMFSLYRMRELGLRARVLEAGSGEGGTWFWSVDPFLPRFLLKCNKFLSVARG
jgi:cation diffusion facilitator CzcD-associated flavoprotein CzcO